LGAPPDVRTLEEALGRAYGYLGKRERTVAEVRSHLAAANATPEVIEKAVDELAQLGYLDDARYARCFAEDRRNLDGWGSERIRRRLIELGLERGLAEEAAEPEDDEQELRAALELLHRRIRSAPSDARARQRALALLIRRGYEQELAYDAIRRFESEAA
jgi:regulatory protein